MPPPAAVGAKRPRGGGARGAEHVSLDGLRADGRRPGEVRRIRLSAGALARADGSAYYEQGNTRVLAAVYGPRDAGARGGGGGGAAGEAVVACEYSVSAFARTGARRARKGDRRSVEAGEMLRRVFEGVVLRKVIPRTRIDVYVQVLQDDGGALVAAVNAASAALVDAGVPMRDLVVACSVGYLDGEFVVDLNKAEGGGGGPELTMAVLGHSGKVSSFTMESRMPNVDVLERALEHGTAGAHQIFKVVEFALKEQALRLLDSRGTIAF